MKREHLFLLGAYVAIAAFLASAMISVVQGDWAAAVLGASAAGWAYAAARLW
jgi:hypothetical protein